MAGVRFPGDERASRFVDTLEKYPRNPYATRAWANWPECDDQSTLMPNRRMCGASLLRLLYAVTEICLGAGKT
jgi:hypothetical protein